MASKTKHSSREKVPSDVAAQTTITLISFGYKEGLPPPAVMTFDVRFLKNPFWIDELRPLTGLDPAVQKYVLEQPSAGIFLNSLSQLLTRLLPQFRNLEIDNLVIALGCTGGQHRSTALVEALATEIERLHPEIKILKQHRELGKRNDNTMNSTEVRRGQ